MTTSRKAASTAHSSIQKGPEIPCICIYVPDLPKRLPLGQSLAFQPADSNARQSSKWRTPDCASYPRAGSDATQLDLLIENGELETKENWVTIWKELLLTRSQLMPLNLKRYLQIKCLRLWTFNHSISNRPTLKTKLDIWARGNILPLRLYRHMFPQNLTSEGFPKPGTLDYSSTVLASYGESKLKQHGKYAIALILEVRNLTRPSHCRNRRTRHYSTIDIPRTWPCYLELLCTNEITKEHRPSQWESHLSWGQKWLGEKIACLLRWNWRTSRSISYHGRSVNTCRSACSTTRFSEPAKWHKQQARWYSTPRDHHQDTWRWTNRLGKQPGVTWKA